jgi:RNA-binding protein
MSEQDDRSMQDLKPTVWIGKQGCTGTMIEEIVAQLKTRKIIKVKWLQNIEVDPKAVAAESKAKLIEVRGRTMVLAVSGKAAGTKVPAKPVAKTTARESVKSTGRTGAKAPRKDAVSARPRRTTGPSTRSRK